MATTEPAPSTPARGTPSRRGRTRSPRPAPRSPTPSSRPVSNPRDFVKPFSTFISALDVPTDGSEPAYDFRHPPKEVDREDDADEQPKPEAASVKRAPRKSKTDAMAALARGDSPSAAAEGAAQGGQAVAPAAGKLDFTAIKTSSPRVLPPRTYPRPFALEDCPVFYPSLEEFKDPMKYMQVVGPKARDYGICKIVPPVGWKMPFVTDTETFRFTTRLQRLNSIEASSRAKLTFLEQLYRFHSSQGNTNIAVPTVNYRRLDLWLLRKEVQKLGGYDAVCKNKKWGELAQIMGYNAQGVAAQLKASYSKVILPFENYSDHVRSAVPIPTEPVHAETTVPAAAEQPTNGADAAGPISPLTVDSQAAEANGEDAQMTEDVKDARLKRRPAEGSNAAAADQPKPSTDQEVCRLCGKDERGTEMLLCDGCDAGYHTFCLDPPLSAIPRGQWFCQKCLFGTGGDYGFDEGEEHTLQSFMMRDLTFRRLWFASHPPDQQYPPTPFDAVTTTSIGDVHYSESDVEREFWRLVQTPFETVEVEYGADVHSTTHGSGMPTPETHPRNPYSRDPWNVNNVPILPESLLRYIKSDISGMTVPWTYVGMIFSTFCWHNEDHYTYSMNYMHWGETKTWYGIPGADALKFEAAIRKEAPDLFDAQPDLLYQLVTLMNPARLRDAGVRVYACNQRAGEFVVTFPRAYHAGFNHGLNFNEAVNFALPDWLPFGLECVKRYQEHRKLPVFSHDELLITVTQHSHSIKTAVWVLDSLREMIDRETAQRRVVREQLPGLQETLEEYDTPENQYQCHVCKAFCYLAQITCGCNPEQVACLEHAQLLCGCEQTARVLRKRFSDEQLEDIYSKIMERASIPTDWQAKLQRTLQDSARPNLRVLRALLAEGERVSFHLPELLALRKCVQRANEWVEVATSFTTRKQANKRVKKPTRGRASGVDKMDVDDSADRPERGLKDVYALLEEVELLGFDCPEIETLRRITQSAEEFKKKARLTIDEASRMDDRDVNIDELETQITIGAGLNMQLEELDEMRRIFMRCKLVRDLEQLEDGSVLLDDIRSLLVRAKACGLTEESKLMKTLLEKQRIGEDWVQKVTALLNLEQKPLPEIERHCEVDSTVPIDPTVLDRLKAVRAKARDLERQARIMLAPEPQSTLPRPSDALKLVARAEKDFMIPVIDELKRSAEFANDLEEKCDAVLSKRFRYAGEGTPFGLFRKWVAYGHTHLSFFQLHNFEKLDRQLIAHSQWIERLPWYCAEHKAVHSDAILRDVRDCTNPDEDHPPSDEFISCICDRQVRPPPPGEASDAVQCDHCFARFHGACAANGGSCPFCDHHHWNGSIHKERNWHFCFLPTMLVTAPDITKFYSTAWKELEYIISRVDRLCVSIGSFLSFASQPGNQRPEFLPQVRHYMRKLFRIQFAISPNPDVSYGLDLAGLHRILAGKPRPVMHKKRRRVKIVFQQDVGNPEPADGTQCLCKGTVRHPGRVQCTICSRWHHETCVRLPSNVSPAVKNAFFCPACSIKRNRAYPYGEVRVRCNDPAHRIPDDARHDIFVDLGNFSLQAPAEQLRRVQLPPNKNALVLDLIRYSFNPGETMQPHPGAQGVLASVSPSPHAPPAPARAMPDPHAPPPPYLGPTPPAFSRKRKTPPADPPAGSSQQRPEAQVGGAPPDDGPPAARKVKLVVKSQEEKDKDSARRNGSGSGGALRIEDLTQ
ncbi:hypothetical protein AURDEDRAFT_183424 [Auricularia subglabra TFB-10046 SS5]|nr:hypothetical protein AURDEDRAFT_183424 [Auricularia subglabra TFB-10046 SS5]